MALVSAPTPFIKIISWHESVSTFDFSNPLKAGKLSRQPGCICIFNTGYSPIEELASIMNLDKISSDGNEMLAEAELSKMNAAWKPQTPAKIVQATYF